MVFRYDVQITEKVTFTFQQWTFQNIVETGFMSHRSRTSASNVQNNEPSIRFAVQPGSTQRSTWQSGVKSAAGNKGNSAVTVHGENIFRLAPCQWYRHLVA